MLPPRYSIAVKLHSYHLSALTCSALALDLGVAPAPRCPFSGRTDSRMFSTAGASRSVAQRRAASVTNVNHPASCQSVPSTIVPNMEPDKPPRNGNFIGSGIVRRANDAATVASGACLGFYSVVQGTYNNRSFRTYPRPSNVRHGCAQRPESGHQWNQAQKRREKRKC